MRMSEKRQKKIKTFRPKARIARGFRDLSGDTIAVQNHMLGVIASIYEQYGFDQLDTPTFEYADALGKFLPDAERPNAGVFALEDDDGQWLSLRYDLTAPLARFVAEHYDGLPKPLRRYQSGYVYRNEKPGPGRYRQFMQMDADTVGAGHPSADAEICMMAVDCMAALGFTKGEYQIRVNNRKVLDAVLAQSGLDASAEAYENQRLTILRAMDKLDRLGLDGVRALLGEGRKDESGDYTVGAKLEAPAISRITDFLHARQADRQATLQAIGTLIDDQPQGQEGLDELKIMSDLFDALGYSSAEITIDPTIVRGLDYYTGPVFEIELTFDITDENGQKAQFGSVGGGGRYDDLVQRFKGSVVPATGISIGVSRLAAALEMRGDQVAQRQPLIVALVLEADRRTEIALMVQSLRKAGFRAEMYVGDSGMKAQLRYADARNARLALIIGEDERQKGTVTVKDLALGRQKSQEIDTNAEWRDSQHSQFEFKNDELLAELSRILS